MQKIKTNGEAVAEIYRNAQLALSSIEDILPSVEDGDIRREICGQQNEYEKISRRAEGLAREMGAEIKAPSPVKKAMMWSAIKMTAAADNSRSNIAQMMIRGTVTGITSLKATLSDGAGVMSGDVRRLMEELISLEEGFERNLKNYL